MIGRAFAVLLSRMQFLHRAIGRWRSKPRPRYALALAGGGVIGGMYEGGALAALEERLNGSGRGFDVYGGCSAGSAVASGALSNTFAERSRTLLIPAIDLNTAERVVFGAGELRDVPISKAVAASSAIPGFFDPYPINGRDYVDGGVGFSGHADLAAEAGADVVVVVNPLVAHLPDGNGDSMRSRGVYTIMEQAGRIYSQNLLTLGLATLAVKFPRTAFFLLQPPRTNSLLFGPSMGFETSRAALRYGYTSTKEWLDHQGAPLVRRLSVAAV